MLLCVHHVTDKSSGVPSTQKVEGPTSCGRRKGRGGSNDFRVDLLVGLDQQLAIGYEAILLY